MARDDKPLELRPVNEDVVESTPVIRLDNLETGRREKEAKPVRLGAADAVEEVSRRLAVPDKEYSELRTHQPGIDVLIDAETSNPDVLEQTWGESSSRRNPIPWGWFVLIGLVIAGAVIWSITHVEKAEVQAKQFRAMTETVRVDDENEDREAELMIERMENAVREVFRATSVEALSRIVRQSERVTPLMREYYAATPLSPVSVKSFKSFQSLTLSGRGNFWMATALLSNGKTRNLIIEVLESGEIRVDWETLVCLQPMKWDDFATQRPAGKSLDFRVYAEADSFYSHEFTNPELWQSFRLTTLDGEETLFGYAHAGSPEAAALKVLLERTGGRRATVILRLMIPEGLTSRRGVVIEKLVNPSWLFIDPPVDGS